MNKKFNKILSVGLSVCMVAVIAGCSSRENPNSSVVPVDSTKSQLYVSNFNGGVGFEWLNKLATRFEEDFAETSFEEGKKGVQVRITNHKGIALSTIPQSKDEVYFLEEVNYYDAIYSGYALDITEMVTEPLTAYGETQSIADKLYDTQLDYWRTSNGKYYGIPHVQSPTVITYDIDLFNRLNLFFDENGEIGKKNTDNGLGKGPDNKAGTYDDGLPATYADFYRLCDTMKGRGVDPMIWSGMYPFYLSNFIAQMKSDYEGADEAKLAFTFDGTATKLVESIDANGNITFRDPVTITEENGYEVYNSAGFYYAYDFIEEIINKNYYANKSFNEGTSHTDAQSLFLLSSFTSEKDIGMLVEGLWWVNEANPTFKQMSSFQGASLMERNLGVMPLPKATTKELGQKAVLLDTINQAAFVSAYVAETKKELAKTFLQYTATQESLEEFVLTTGLPRGFNVDYSAVMNQLSPYTKSILNLFDNSDYVMSSSGASVFQKNYAVLECEVMCGTDEYRYANIAIKEGKTSLEMFNDIRNKFSAARWNNML